MDSLKPRERCGKRCFRDAPSHYFAGFAEKTEP
jgi:hypothetical protein